MIGLLAISGLKIETWATRPLISLTAAKHGCAVLTRNVADFDLLMQLAPGGKAVFYDV